jgi:hypothetical protein
LSEALGEILIVAVIIAVCVSLHAIWQRRSKSELLRKNNDVAGFLFSAVGVIYAVVLGFVVVVVWEKYDATVANVDTEIAAVSDLYRVAGGLPDPVRSQVREELRSYTNGMIDSEWPQLAQRQIIPKDLDLLERLAHQINGFVPRDAGQADVQQSAMQQVERLFDARRLRLIQSAPSVPMVLWFALGAGALAMLSFAFLFGVENRGAQLVMTAILAGLVAILFIVILEFDSPFNGSVRISDDGWILLQQHLSHIP